MNCIAYNTGYKFQLKEPYALLIPIRPDAVVSLEFLSLTREGLLTINKGYAWDGPSGPTIDTLNFMRGSLVHDVLYQLMREGKLDHAVHRLAADRLLRALCLEDGMSRLRAWVVYQGVRRFGDPSADPAHQRPVIRAPKGCQEVPPRGGGSLPTGQPAAPLG